MRRPGKPLIVIRQQQPVKSEPRTESPESVPSVPQSPTDMKPHDVELVASAQPSLVENLQTHLFIPSPVKSLASKSALNLTTQKQKKK